MMDDGAVDVRPKGAERGVEPGAGNTGRAVPRPRAPRREQPRAEGAVATDAAARPGDPAHPDFVHVAAVVRSDTELFGAATSWVQEGVEAGDLVMVGGTPSFQQVIAEEFGDVDRVRLDDRVRPNGRRGPDALAAIIAHSREAAASGSGRLRVLAQVDQPDDPREVREFACLESVSNLMPIAAPSMTLCIYDERHLPPTLVDTAPATHPNLLGADGVTPSDGYVEPHEFVRGLPVPREPLQDSPPRLAVDDAPALAGLRRALGDQLAAVVPDRDQRDDLHLAIAEMAANAFRHGARPVSARVWASADRLVCTITDGGSGPGPDRVYGYWPAHGQDLGRGGMGLWLARTLCDHVDVSRDERGTTVRLATALR
jgi:anti-sigma regulatory factor (Ser/Thr protein kinase)